MKYSKLSRYEVIALAVILCGVVLRLFLIAHDWPFANSDEGTMGIMALHITNQGDHPIFLDGQNYLGAWQAYLGAALFRLFGASLFSLRLGLLLMITLFLLSSYVLARLLYDRKLALITIILLSFGSAYVLIWQLVASGGYPETLLCSSMAFMLASWLALSFRPDAHWLYHLGRRCAVYLCWGVVVGWGIWNHLLVLPFVVASALLLVLCCWRELVSILPPLGALIGGLIGAFPFIWYNFHAAPGQDSLSILRGIEAGGSGKTHALLPGLLNTFQISVPMMTGEPFCPVNDLSFFGPTSPPSVQCTIVRGIWGWGYLIVLIVAFTLAAVGSVYYWRRCLRPGELPSERQRRIRYLARFLLLVAAVLTLYSFSVSAAPISWAGSHGRYLIGLLVATPALVWPLYEGAKYAREQVGRWRRIAGIACASILVGITIMTLVGTGITLQEVPSVQAGYQHDQTFISQLLSIGAVHIYTDYWTCDKIAFESQERVICGVVDANLQPTHNREARYYQIVSQDKSAAYAFLPSEMPPALAQLIVHNRAGYRHFVFQGYDVYQPIIKT
jgi:hypothetical protein